MLSRILKIGCICALILAGTSTVNAQTGIVEFTEAYRIGDEGAGDSIFFRNVVSMAVDSQGRLYLTDFTGNKSIQMFSPDGVPIHEIGREGGGTGEFEFTPTVHIGLGDTLYAWEQNSFRLTTFSPEDQSLVSSKTIGNHGSRATRPLRFLGAVNQGYLMEFAGSYIPGSLVQYDMGHFASIVTWDGNAPDDRLAQLPSANYVVFETNSISGIRFLPYSARPNYVLSADQVLYHGMSDAIQLTGTTLEGEDVHKISLPHTPVSVSASERESRAGRIQLEQLRKDVLANIPEHKPAYVWLLSDDAGHIWMLLSKPENEQTSTWLVMNASGETVATAQIPDGIRLMAVRGGRAYGSQADESSGEPIVIAWEISW
ncbi:MAG: hypothetical protein F4Y90_01080 [Rhodothermaceae bacterium]|nr:hypothetical protein [Rhodothermaceae bacterium]